MLEGEELRGVTEIVRWFAFQGIRVMIVHVPERDEWQAPMFAMGKPPIGAEGLGRGPTALAAAEDLKARYEAGEIKHHVYVHDEARGDDSAQVERRDEPPATVAPAGVASEEAVGSPTVERVEKLAAHYGWGIVFIDEPDGRVRGYLIDPKRGEIMKAYLGDDFHDAWLGLGMDTYPPSAEGRT